MSGVAIALTLSVAPIPAGASADDKQASFDTAALLAPLANPEDASQEAFRKSWRTFYGITRTSPEGPKDSDVRRVLFQFVDQVLALDYGRLCEAWLHDIPPERLSGDGCFPEENQKDVAAYLDKIVDPARDQEHAGTILRHASAVGIAKLGPPARDQVIAAATTESPLIGRRYPRAEAIGALGVWIDNSDPRFTTAEKRELTTTLQLLLPEPASGRFFGPKLFTTRAALEALGHSDDEIVRQALQSWAIEYVRAHGRDPLSDLASAMGRIRRPAS